LLERDATIKGAASTSSPKYSLRDANASVGTVSVWAPGVKFWIDDFPLEVAYYSPAGNEVSGPSAGASAILFGHATFGMKGEATKEGLWTTGHLARNGEGNTTVRAISSKGGI